MMVCRMKSNIMKKASKCVYTEKVSWRMSKGFLSLAIFLKSYNSVQNKLLHIKVANLDCVLFSLKYQMLKL